MNLDILPVEELFNQASALSHSSHLGKDKAVELECARAIVEQEISVRVDVSKLPKAVAALLNDAWKDVLAAIYVEDGYGSVRWQLSLEITDELIWTFGPKNSVSERSKMIAMLPTLVKVLRQGLASISWDPKDTDQMFKSLEKYHVTCLRSNNTAIPVKPKKAEQAPVKKAPQADTTHQIEMLEGLEEDMNEMTSTQQDTVEEGWVFKADINEWVFVGDAVQQAATRSTHKKEPVLGGASKSSSFRVRKIGPGDG